MKKLNLKSFKGGPGNLFIAAVLFLGILIALTKLAEITRSTLNPNYTEFKKQIINNKVDSVEISGSEIAGRYKDGKTNFEVTVQEPSQILGLLEKHNVDISFASQASDFSFWHILLLLSFVMIPLIAWYFFKQSKGSGSGGGGNIFTMSKSKAKMVMPSQIKVNFDSVAGAYEAKEELQDIIDFLRNPDKYKNLGAKLTKGALLVGEPGNGKTLLAKAVAGEANCPFFSISGSDFIEVFVGVGAARVRDLFAQARKYSPSIIFIDEIDAVGRQRGNGLGGGHDEREQTLNQLLAEMDGFDTSGSVIILAATNRPDVLDKALLRPGRFDRQVEVPYPDLKSREEILDVHSKEVKMSNVIDLSKIARGTPGFTGADLANLINEAAINASKYDQKDIQLSDFEEARDKILLGKERKSIMLNSAEREVIAYHEAGHALVALLTPKYCDPLYKVTIIPRGRALGVTHSLPEREKHSRSKEEMESEVMMALGGRAAEELIFNRLEVGAASDFMKATKVVRQMICYYGMSSKLGLVIYEQNSDYKYSQKFAQEIDDEVREFMNKYYQATVKLLKDNKDKLVKLATALLEKETMFPSEIYKLLDLESREEHLFS